MSMAFDSLGFVRRLEEAGVARKQAEAHADAARDFILDGVATKPDLERLDERIGQKLDSLELRMTIKLGGFLVIAVGVIVTLERLLA